MPSRLKDLIVGDKQMPKLKTKSGAKKRFSLTGSGKVRRNRSRHRHNLTKQLKKNKREQRRIAILAPGDAAIIKRFMPYGSR